MWNQGPDQFLLLHLSDEGTPVNPNSNPKVAGAYRRLRRALIAWTEGDPKVAEPDFPKEVPDEIRDALEALGYLEEEFEEAP